MTNIDADLSQAAGEARRQALERYGVLREGSLDMVRFSSLPVVIQGALMSVQIEEPTRHVCQMGS